MYSSQNLELLMEKFLPSGMCDLNEYNCYNTIVTQNSIWPDKLYKTRFTTDNIELELDKAEKLATTKKIPKLLFCPPTEVEVEVLNSIKKRNYKQGYWRAMTLKKPFPKAQNHFDELELSVFRETSQLKEWHALIETELMSGGPLNIQLFPHLLTDNECYFIQGKKNERIVTAGFMLVHGKAAGIYLVATVTKERGKGYGTALIEFCIKIAEKQNVDFIHLQATQQGEPIYHKLGFKDYGKIEFFNLTEKLEA